MAASGETRIYRATQWDRRGRNPIIPQNPTVEPTIGMVTSNQWPPQSGTAATFQSNFTRNEAIFGSLESTTIYHGDFSTHPTTWPGSYDYFFTSRSKFHYILNFKPDLGTYTDSFATNKILNGSMDANIRTYIENLPESTNRRYSMVFYNEYESRVRGAVVPSSGRWAPAGATGTALTNANTNYLDSLKHWAQVVKDHAATLGRTDIMTYSGMSGYGLYPTIYDYTTLGWRSDLDGIVNGYAHTFYPWSNPSQWNIYKVFKDFHDWRRANTQAKSLIWEQDCHEKSDFSSWPPGSNGTGGIESMAQWLTEFYAMCRDYGDIFSVAYYNMDGATYSAAYSTRDWSHPDNTQASKDAFSAAAAHARTGSTWLVS